MKRFAWRLALILLSTCSGLFAGAFPVDFQAAVRLSQTPGKMAEAEAAFLELANRKVRRSQGPDAALERASMCALSRQDFEAAERHITGIKEPALQTLCRLRIWAAQQRWQDILGAVGDQDLEAWPDRLIHDAAMLRGMAHAIQGDAAAERDFLLACATTFDARELGFANLALGNLYRDQLTDVSKALAAYRQVIDSTATGASKYDSTIAYALIVAGQGKADEAIGQLDKLPLETISSPDWQCRIQQAYGDVYAALNRTDDAVAAYRKALAVPEVSPYLVRGIEEKIGNIAPTESTP